MRKIPFKVYEITLLPHESFVFYKHVKGFTCVNSLEYTCPTNVSHVWNGSDLVSYHSPDNKPYIHKIALPIVASPPELLQSYVVSNGIGVAKTLLSDEKNEFDIFAVTKPIENNLLAVGLCGYDSFSDKRNYNYEYEINRYFKLKAFW